LASRDLEAASNECSACFSTEGEGDEGELAVEPLGPASVVCSDTGQTLREDRPVATHFVAEEPPDAQVNGVTGIPCQARSESALLYWEWTLLDRIPHTGQRALVAEGFAKMVMAFASARIPMRSSTSGAASTVRESGIDDLDDLLVLLGCQLAAPRHRKLGRTVQAGQTQTHPAPLLLLVAP